MPDILAMLLPSQIKRASHNLALRQQIANRYMDELQGVVNFPYVNSRAKHAWHIFAVSVDPAIREQLLIDLFNVGVGSTIHFKALHTTTYYANKYGFKPSDFPVAYEWGESVFSLPVFPSLTLEEQEYVINQLKILL